MGTINDMPSVADISVDNALCHVGIAAYSHGHTLDCTVLRNERDDSAVIGVCPDCGLQVVVFTIVGNMERSIFPDYRISWSNLETYNGSAYVRNCRDMRHTG